MLDLLEENKLIPLFRSQSDMSEDCLPPHASELKKLYMQACDLRSMDRFVPNMGRAVHQNVDEWRKAESTTQRLMGKARQLWWIIACNHAAAATTIEDTWTFYYELKEAEPEPAARPAAKEDFLDRARRLENLGRVNSALDVVYNHVDEMLLAGKFTELDNRIATIACDDYSVDLLLAMLTITHAAKSHLPHREDFYEQVEDSIRHRGELDEGLLFGLD